MSNMSKRRRRRSDLGRTTRGAKRMRLRISKETPEERAIRLKYSREKSSLRRAAETPEERETRLRRVRDRQRLRRANESDTQRQARLFNDRFRKNMRKLESSGAADLWTDEVKAALNNVVFIECKKEPISTDDE